MNKKSFKESAKRELRVWLVGIVFIIFLAVVLNMGGI